jgi:hypothetical protein
LQEPLVADLFDVGLLGAKGALVKEALVDEVAAQRVLVASGQRAVRPEGLDAVAQLAGRAVEVLVVDALLVARAVDDADARLARVDVDGVVRGLLVEPDLDLVVVPGVGRDLGSIQRVNV